MADLMYIPNSSIPHGRHRVPGLINPQLDPYVPPVEITSLPTHATTSGGSSITFSHTVIAGTKQVLVVCVDWDNSGRTITSITYDDVSMGAAIDKAGSGSTGRAAIYCLVAPSVGTHDVVVTFSDTVYAAAGAVVLDNVNQLAPYSGTQKSEVADNLTVVSATTSLVVGCVAFWDNGANITDDANQTSLYMEIIDGAWQGAGSIKDGAASCNIGWTYSLAYGACIATSFNN